MLTKEHLQVKVLSVRVSEAEMRRLKSLAANRGMSVQKAVQEALDLWEAQVSAPAPPAVDDLRGSLAGVDVQALRREEKGKEAGKDRHWL